MEHLSPQQRFSLAAFVRCLYSATLVEVNEISVVTQCIPNRATREYTFVVKAANDLIQASTLIPQCFALLKIRHPQQNEADNGIESKSVLVTWQPGTQYAPATVSPGEILKQLTGVFQQPAVAPAPVFNSVVQNVFARVRQLVSDIFASQDPSGAVKKRLENTSVEVTVESSPADARDESGAHFPFAAQFRLINFGATGRVCSISIPHTGIEEKDYHQMILKLAQKALDVACNAAGFCLLPGRAGLLLAAAFNHTHTSSATSNSGSGSSNSEEDPPPLPNYAMDLASNYFLSTFPELSSDCTGLEEVIQALEQYEDVRNRMDGNKNNNGYAGHYTHGAPPQCFHDEVVNHLKFAHVWRVDEKQRLKLCLERFSCKNVPHLGAEDNNQVIPYIYSPQSAVDARLGSGAFGTVYRMQRNPDATGARFAVKCLPKAGEQSIIKSPMTLLRACSEISLGGRFYEEYKKISQRIEERKAHGIDQGNLEEQQKDEHDLRCLSHLNKRRDLLDNKDFLYIVTDYVTGEKAAPIVDLAHWFRIFESNRTDLILGLPDQQVGNIVPLPVSDTVNGVMKKVGTPGLPLEVSKVLLKQLLLGISYMDEKMCVVHRDIKNENLMVAITRSAVYLYEKDGDQEVVEGPSIDTPLADIPPPYNRMKRVGIRLKEKYGLQIIDFGLSKYLVVNMTALPNIFSPGTFEGIVHAAERMQQAQAPVPAPGVPGAEFLRAMHQPNAAPAAPPPPTACFYTPMGTPEFLAIEAIQHVTTKPKDEKMDSTTKQLPKIDVFAAACVFLCMINGTSAPFDTSGTRRKSPSFYKKMSTEIEHAARDGPKLAVTAPILDANTIDIFKLMLTCDPKLRPSAAELLGMEYFKAIDNDTVYWDYRFPSSPSASLARFPSIDPAYNSGAANNDLQTHSVVSGVPCGSGAADNVKNNDEGSDDDGGDHLRFYSTFYDTCGGIEGK